MYEKIRIETLGETAFDVPEDYKLGEFEFAEFAPTSGNDDYGINYWEAE